ncbi:hypothetical protein M1116_02765 [Patescibacteria group bacterium]|nr:hypothetical protein [Patescibacteria group bacterium]
MLDRLLQVIDQAQFVYLDEDRPLFPRDPEAMIDNLRLSQLRGAAVAIDHSQERELITPAEALIAHSHLQQALDYAASVRNSPESQPSPAKTETPRPHRTLSPRPLRTR